MLKQIFTELIGKYTADPVLCNDFWVEIESAYTEPHRHYHNLTHLENLISVLKDHREVAEDYNALLFSVFYHDFIYDVTRQDNEEASAALAVLRMSMLGVPENTVRNCCEQILATKAHAENTDPDTNLFTDADLSVLGRDYSSYMEYTAQIRQEYIIYPDTLYNPGRIQVLEHFLAQNRIFKTEAFFLQSEEQARLNIKGEIALLSTQA